jgi:WD40 repeat protein
VQKVGVIESQLFQRPSRVLVWKIAPDKVEQILSVPFGLREVASSGESIGIATSADSTLLAVSTMTGRTTSEIRVWNLTTAKETHAFRSLAGDFEYLAFSKDNKRLIAAGVSNYGTSDHLAEARIWELDDGQELMAIPLGNSLGTTLGATNYHFDGNRFLGVGWNEKGGELRILNASKPGE